MFDKLLELIGQFWDTVKVFEILNPYQEGVHLRNGKFVKEIGPGFWMKWPVIDEFMTDITVPSTYTMHEQTLTTIDGFTVVIRGVITSQIQDIKKALLGAEDLDGIRADVCYAAVSEAVEAMTWEEIRDSEAFSKEITKRSRKRARKYGLDVIEIRAMDKVKLKAYRLIGER